jgi:arginine:ornithine antiporter/lysine permease
MKAPNKQTSSSGDGKVGLFGLTALIVGSAIGSGIFALPATLTGGAGSLGILCGWAIVALGMLALVSVYAVALVLRGVKTSTTYAFKCACTGKGYEGAKAPGRLREMALSSFAVVFVLFMLYGAGLKYILLAAVVWAVGLPLFVIGKREQRARMTLVEWAICAAVVLMALVGLLGIWTGKLAL